MFVIENTKITFFSDFRIFAPNLGNFNVSRDRFIRCLSHPLEIDLFKLNFEPKLNLDPLNKHR